MNCHRLTALIVYTGIFLFADAIGPTARAQDPVTVMLGSGRSFTAWIDERTDESTLWLRFQSPHISIRRPIAWDQVASAEHSGAALSVEQLRQLAPTIKTSQSDVPPRAMQREEVVAPDTTSPDSTVPERQRSPATTLAVRSMTVDAQLGNWDEDEEPDGLVVWIEPRDAYGRLMQISGNADVRLLAPMLRRFHEAPTSRGASLDEIASWTRNIQPGAVGDEGAQLLLPFQAIDPEFNERVGNFGMVHVQLVVPGHGVLQRRIPLVRLRTFSPLRDRFGQFR
jgi:hypothetical protein